jgi:hypothetical protein
MGDRIGENNDEHKYFYGAIFWIYRTKVKTTKLG